MAQDTSPPPPRIEKPGPGTRGVGPKRSDGNTITVAPIPERHDEVGERRSGHRDAQHGGRANSALLAALSATQVWTDDEFPLGLVMPAPRAPSRWMWVDRDGHEAPEQEWTTEPDDAAERLRTRHRRRSELSGSDVRLTSWSELPAGGRARIPLFRDGVPHGDPVAWTEPVVVASLEFHGDALTLTLGKGGPAGRTVRLEANAVAWGAGLVLPTNTPSAPDLVPEATTDMTPAVAVTAEPGTPSARETPSTPDSRPGSSRLASSQSFVRPVDVSADAATRPAGRGTRSRLRVALTAAVQRAERLVRWRVYQARHLPDSDAARRAFGDQLRADRDGALAVMERAWDDRWWNKATPEQIGRAWQASTESAMAGDAYAIGTLGHMRARVHEHFGVRVPEQRLVTRPELMRMMAEPRLTADDPTPWFRFTIRRPDGSLHADALVEAPPGTTVSAYAAHLLDTHAHGLTDARIELTHSTAGGAAGQVAVLLDAADVAATLARDAEHAVREAAAARMAITLDAGWWARASPLEIGSLWATSADLAGPERAGIRAHLATRLAENLGVAVPIDAHAVQVTEMLAERVGGRLGRVDRAPGLDAPRDHNPRAVIAEQLYDAITQGRLLERQAERATTPARADQLREQAAHMHAAADRLLERGARVGEADAVRGTTHGGETAAGLERAARQYAAMWDRELGPREEALLRHLLTRGFASPTEPAASTRVANVAARLPVPLRRRHASTAVTER